MQANEARGAVANVFSASDGDPLFSPSPDGTAGSSDQPVDPDAVKTILLLGGDAGPGRWGLRTDTMILVSVHEASGRTSLVSIPRNLTRLQFPPGTPLAEEFPDGFDDLTNAVFPYVSTRDDLMAHYGRNGLQAEAVALSEGLGYSLDVEIDDYALVNMQGFTEVIDAVGGFTIELGERVPLPPSLPGERPLPDAIGPGLVEMDGALAIAYALVAVGRLRLSTHGSAAATVGRARLPGLRIGCDQWVRHRHRCARRLDADVAVGG